MWDTLTGFYAYSCVFVNKFISPYFYFILKLFITFFNLQSRSTSFKILMKSRSRNSILKYAVFLHVKNLHINKNNN